MVPSKTLPRSQLSLGPRAVLTRVVVASKQERVRHLAPEFPWNVNESHEANHGGPRKCKRYTANNASSISLNNLGFPIEYQAERTPNRNHG